MPKIVKPLTDTEVKSAKPKEKEYLLSDGGGLALIVGSDGSKRWRFNYIRPKLNTRNNLSFGVYPAVTLSKARELRNEARQKVANDIDPSSERQETKQADKQSGHTLDNVFNEWFNSINIKKRASTTNSKDKDRYGNDLAPWLGKKHIKDIKRAEAIECLKRLDERTGGESGRKLKTLCNQIWRYAVTHDYCEHNIIADIDSSVILQVAIKRQHSHITDPKELAEMMRCIDRYKGDFVTVCALKLAPLLIVRPLNIRFMGWSEIDFDKALWTIPAQKDESGKQTQGNRMKMNAAHTVPLSTQALAILKEIQPLTGHTPYVFFKATTRDKVINGDTLSKALRSMGYKDQQTTHGFRHTASTILNESGDVDSKFIESALAHTNGGKMEATYNKAKYIEQRKVMMQWWADFLDGLKNG